MNCQATKIGILFWGDEARLEGRQMIYAVVSEGVASPVDRAVKLTWWIATLLIKTVDVLKLIICTSALSDSENGKLFWPPSGRSYSVPLSFFDACKFVVLVISTNCCQWAVVLKLGVWSGLPVPICCVHTQYFLLAWSGWKFWVKVISIWPEYVRPRSMDQSKAQWHLPFG